MNWIHITLLISLSWMQLQTIQSQCWNGYNVRNALDGYSLYTYPVISPPAYDCNSLVYNTCPANTVEYCPPPCNTCPSDSNQPIVVIVNGDIVDSDEWDLVSMLSVIPNLKDQCDGGPIYITYPGTEPCGNCNCDCRCGSEPKCGCRNACGCSSCANSNKYDCVYIDDCNYGCCDCKKQRCRTECSCNSGCRNPSSDCDRCNKCCNGKPKACRC